MTLRIHVSSDYEEHPRRNTGGRGAAEALIREGPCVMSETALALYEKACNVQAQRTEARRIRTRVRDARADTMGADSGWPFELLQNVHDAGPRANKEHVNVAFRWDGTTLLFEHDGTP